MANGGLITYTGAHILSICAQAHSVPVLVISGMYKLTPLFVFETETYNEVLSPLTIHRPRDKESQGNIEVPVPQYDYVPPELVTLYITNEGSHTPMYIYRLFSDMYSHEDDENIISN